MESSLFVFDFILHLHFLILYLLFDLLQFTEQLLVLTHRLVFVDMLELADCEFVCQIDIANGLSGDPLRCLQNKHTACPKYNSIVMVHLHRFIDVLSVEEGEVSSLFAVGADEDMVLTTVYFCMIGLNAECT